MTLMSEAPEPVAESPAPEPQATILVVDDQPENIDVLRGILRAHYRVRVATSGQQALETAVMEPVPDMVLLDVSMPDMDGYEVCRRLRRNISTHRIPVIFVSALCSADDELRGFEAGGADYITKPVSPGRVLARIKTHLALHNQSRHLEQLVATRTRELRRTRLKIIQRLGRAAEYSDDETGNHVIRMAHYARALALAHGLSSEEAENIFDAAPMHDVGKIGIPDVILGKPNKLDPQEWSVMRQHPAIGASIIGKHDDPLLETARVVALSHHEKWDGTGYPQGLRGNEIPLPGRIVAVADVFDALTSNRPYKKAWPIDAALGYIREQAGLHFDPKLARQFLTLVPQLMEIRARFRDEDVEMLVQPKAGL